MSNLYMIKELVQACLEAKPECRANDSLLLREVLQICGSKKGINLDTITGTQLIGYMASHALPQPESIRRSRQKVQEECPHLRPPEGVRRARKEQEAEYFRFATRGYRL